MEIWRDIEGFEGLYQVSDLGRVKSLERNIVKGRGGLYKIEEKILKSSKDKNGYLKVHLYKEGKQKTYLVHRLVASTFLDNPDSLPEVNHKDENPQNNCVENLEYCNSKYNSNYGSRNERVVKSLSKPILQFAKDGKFIKKWDSATQVERELNLNQSHISYCCKGKLKSAYGYKWKYYYKGIWIKKHIPQIKLKKVA